jgi:hypothetical protein
LAEKKMEKIFGFQPYIGFGVVVVTGGAFMGSLVARQSTELRGSDSGKMTISNKGKRIFEFCNRYS